MLNFQELPPDGQDFELLVREIMFREGFHVEWSGRGADGGRDLVCTESRRTILGTTSTRWLVQCKHFAHSGKSVGIGDLDDIVSSAAQHKCSGYLLACSTVPSSGVVQRLEAISANQELRLTTNFWDAVQIERMLATPLMWRIAQRFFPKTATGFEIYATESPNHWVVNYKGYYFHLSNRIGSHAQMHLQSIEARVEEIQALKLPENHEIRIRAIYYDDKNGGYVWYLDYLRPSNDKAAVSVAKLKRDLRDGWALEDGQAYSFDIVLRSTSPSSDHYDPDHYDYYERDSRIFRWGGERRIADFEFASETADQDARMEQATRENSFNAMVAALEQLPFMRLIRAENCDVESVREFARNWDWSELLENGMPRFFSVAVYFWVDDEALFKRFMAAVPQGIEPTFRLTKAIVYLPSEHGGSELSSDEEGPYELTLSAGPFGAPDMYTTRDSLNAYMDRVTSVALNFQALSSNAT
jgi:hypothetical protein